MRWLAVNVLLTAFGCSALLAQGSAQFRSCMDNADTQHAMHVCANEEAKRVNAELDDTYRKLLSAAANSSYEPEAVAKIANAEKAWVAYRDAYIEANYPAKDKQGVYGTIFPMQVDLLWVKLTRKHIEELNDLLRHYSGVPGY